MVMFICKRFSYIGNILKAVQKVGRFQICIDCFYSSEKVFFQNAQQFEKSDY